MVPEVRMCALELAAKMGLYENKHLIAMAAEIADFIETGTLTETAKSLYDSRHGDLK